MSTGGLSRARLGRLHDVMTGYVERGEVPGRLPRFLDLGLSGDRRLRRLMASGKRNRNAR